MLFNSIAFACFLPVIFVLYWFVTARKLMVQNAMLVVASYFFYACWDWRFLFLLLFSTVLDYISGLQMSASKNEVTKKFWFVLSIVVNLGFLGVIKYYDFFATSFVSLFHSFGISLSIQTLHIILPVGISFYTFHGLSYIIDCYKNRIKAEKNIVDYALFVSFFPLLVAGPIERATHLLPQLKKPRTFKYEQAVAGLQQILWGLFKKSVIADNLAQFVNPVYNQQISYDGFTLLVATVFFSFQIYCDISGYSDMAVGIAKLFGINLMKNFNRPYFALSITDFWRRWHISLSTWFKDYVYLPMGGNKVSLFHLCFNILVVFIISGFWHGAKWTFVIWGLVHGLALIFNKLTSQVYKKVEVVLNKLQITQLVNYICTFAFVNITWVFFRANQVGDAFSILVKIFKETFLDTAVGNFIEGLPLIGFNEYKLVFLFGLVFVLIYLETLQKNNLVPSVFAGNNKFLRYGFIYLLTISIVCFGYFGKSTFIYFQF